MNNSSLMGAQNSTPVSGILLGVSLALLSFDLVTGILTSAIVMFFSVRKISLKDLSKSEILGLITAFYAGAITLIFKKGDTLYVALPMLLLLFSISIASTVKFDDQSKQNIFAVFTLILFVDFSLNVYYWIFGADPFDRVVDIREDSLIRLNGLYGHSFLSIAISILGLIVGTYRKSYLIIFIALINLAINQSLRSYIYIFLFISWYFVTFSKQRFKYYLSISILNLLTVIYFTATSDSTSNILRTFAWANALLGILENPLLGSHQFIRFDKDLGVSELIFSESGVAENLYLQLAWHFGIPIGLGFLIILCNAMHKITIPNSDFWLLGSSQRAREILIYFCFADSLFGSFLSTPLICFIYVLFYRSDVTRS